MTGVRPGKAVSRQGQGDDAVFSAEPRNQRLPSVERRGIAVQQDDGNAIGGALIAVMDPEAVWPFCEPGMLIRIFRLHRRGIGVRRAQEQKCARKEGKENERDGVAFFHGGNLGGAYRGAKLILQLLSGETVPHRRRE